MTEPTVRFRFPPVSDGISGNFGDWYGSYQHRGTDFASPMQTPVYAPAAGRIVAPVNDGSFGYAVCIDHGDGWFTLYAHLSYVSVGVGDWVEPGYILGLTGNSGWNSSGQSLGYAPHLHWQFCDSKSFPVDISHSRDPMLYIVEVPDMTEAEVLELINQLKSNGDLASTTDVLACVAQIAGSETLTYTDIPRVEAARAAMGNLPATGQETVMYDPEPDTPEPDPTEPDPDDPEEDEDD